MNLKLILIVVAAAVLTSSIVWGVYKICKGTTTAAHLTFRQSDSVRMEKVIFKNRIGIEIAGHMYMPKNIDKNKKHPAIVVGHTFTGVKEQTSGLHAQKLAEMGFVTLAFDASFWGESGGQPRNIEIPDIRIEDFIAAVDFLSTQSLVDAGRIGLLGICGGGGYVVSAAAIDHRVKAVATVSMYDLGRARRQGLGDAISYEQRMKTLDLIGDLRTKEFRGEKRTDTLGVPASITDKDTENTREFYDYYRTPRAQHPNTDTAYSLVSQAAMMNFFPFIQIETISPRPLLFIVGERAVSAYFSEDAYSKAAQPKELYVVPGASHVDLYDRPEYMKLTIPKLDSFFKQNLK
ncbi:Hydrolases family protein [Elusimicrobium minutum Pei191]|uniref:Hydrolases family protein n=1 Tax=Elusimicrobium minutum (strain Pei191) TaxID=445932 RepID=B2KD35_ELUMP|nr:alpha/beta hydrolase [Elusimicrobium minutum]ACC98431.1 Hydrolases family protein [Elusimicrobium minutum Pei191]